MQARYYDPVIGRFLSADPIGYGDGLNVYAYVGNDPINATDPTGKAAFVIPIVIEGASWAAAAWRIARAAAAATAAATALNEATKPETAPTPEVRPSHDLPARDGATVERPGKTGSRDEILGKSGTVDDANKDFDNSVDPNTVRDLGGGVRTGTATNGANITVRPGSKSGEPTIDVTRGNGKDRDTDKIRYRPPEPVNLE